MHEAARRDEFVVKNSPLTLQICWAKFPSGGSKGIGKR